MPGSRPGRSRWPAWDWPASTAPRTGSSSASGRRRGHWAERLILVNDGDLVVAAGTPEGWGVGVIAGTGSIAVARAPDGRKSRAGGWGHLIGDEGSAYGLVLAAFVGSRGGPMAARPPLMSPDPLSVHLCRALGITRARQARLWSSTAPGFDRSKIAALAPAVLAAADLDPSIVDELLRPAGAELALMAIAAAEAVGWNSGRLPLAIAGGFLLSAEVVRHALEVELRAHGYEPIPAPVTEPARVSAASCSPGQALTTY